MKVERQRIKIAEACGYKIIDSPTAEGFVRLQKPDGNPVCSVGEESRNNIWPAAIAWNWIPDYPNDLNAMHEAEKALFEEGLALSVMSPELRRELYFSQLIKVCGDRPAMSATAAQRAEAFLKTLGLWEET